MAKNKHCWHGGNIVLTSNPPQYPETCCNCGAERRLTFRVTYESGHGKFATAKEKHERYYFYPDEQGEKPCTPEVD